MSILKRQKMDGTWEEVTSETIIESSTSSEDIININTQLTKTRTFQTATGTANNIILTDVLFQDGYSVTFVAIANNNGTPTGVNGKPLYKPATTTAPTLIANKAYTIWYNLSNNCFFIKASAEGNAVAANVLAGKTFSNDSEVGLIGTLNAKQSMVATTNVGTAEYTNFNFPLAITIPNINFTPSSVFITTNANLCVGNTSYGTPQPYIISNKLGIRIIFNGWGAAISANITMNGTNAIITISAISDYTVSLSGLANLNIYLYE